MAITTSRGYKKYSLPSDEKIGAIAIAYHGGFYNDMGIECHIYRIEIAPL